MMGIPASEFPAVFRCSNIILSNGDPEYIPEGNDPVGAFLEAGQELTELMQALAARRLEDPLDDLTTALITTNIDGESLTHAELASFFILLLTAGNETTRKSISHALWAFTEYPEQRALWQADPAAVAPTGVDEIVRWASPVIWMRRTVTEATVLTARSCRPATRCCSSTTRPTETRPSSRNPSPSMSAARPTRTSASGRPAHISVWAPTWPAGRST